MAVRTALLTSRNINLDTDFSKYIESVTDAGIISGFTVTASSVAAGTAWVPCTRTNLETIYALVQNFSAVSISGNGYVIIKVDDSIVDNGGGNEDGTGIATIEVVASLPSKNYLHLATITNGTVTMVAPTIKKLNELNTEIESIFAQLADLDGRVEALEEADAIDHLEESGLVWELYTLNDTLFKQYAPTLENSTIAANVGDVAANTEIHIQAMGSGEASNTLKLKVKKTGNPTTSLKVEVRKGIQVTVTANSEAYWYGDSNNIYATGTLASSSFSTSWAEVTFTLDNEVGGTKWELLDVVVYQTTGSGATVNSSNYYVLACDSTQYSEGFSYVSVNGSTRARSKLMPYLSSVWFVQAMLCKADMVNRKRWPYAWNANRSTSKKIWDFSPSVNGYYKVVWELRTSLDTVGAYIMFNGGSMVSTYSTSFIPFEIIENATAGSTYSLRCGVLSNGGALAYYQKLYIYECRAKATYNIVSIKPYSVVWLWEFTTCFLYWIKDWKYEGGLMLSKDTNATTGSITLGNAVGYIKVNFNGEIIKIPYYNE